MAQTNMHKELSNMMHQPFLKLNALNHSFSDIFLPELYHVCKIVPSFADIKAECSLELEEIMKKRPTVSQKIKINMELDTSDSTPQLYYVKEDVKPPSPEPEVRPIIPKVNRFMKKSTGKSRSASDMIMKKPNFDTKTIKPMSKPKPACRRFNAITKREIKIRVIPRILANTKQRLRDMSLECRELYFIYDIQDCFVLMNKLTESELKLAEDIVKSLDPPAKMNSCSIEEIDEKNDECSRDNLPEKECDIQPTCDPMKRSIEFLKEKSTGIPKRRNTLDEPSNIKQICGRRSSAGDVGSVIDHENPVHIFQNDLLSNKSKVNDDCMLNANEVQPNENTGNGVNDELPLPNSENTVTSPQTPLSPQETEDDDTDGKKQRERTLSSSSTENDQPFKKSRIEEVNEMDNTLTDADRRHTDALQSTRDIEYQAVNFKNYDCSKCNDNFLSYCTWVIHNCCKN